MPIFLLLGFLMIVALFHLFPFLMPTMLILIMIWWTWAVGTSRTIDKIALDDPWPNTRKL